MKLKRIIAVVLLMSLAACASTTTPPMNANEDGTYSAWALYTGKGIGAGVPPHVKLGNFATKQ